MRPLLFAVILGYTGGVAWAGVKTPTPAPIRPTELAAKIDGVRIDYGDKSVVVHEAAWLTRFRKTLAEASLLPADYCFCDNLPTYTLLAGKETIGTFEIPHGRKLRISGPMLRGEFSIATSTGVELGRLADEVAPQARPKEDSPRPSEDLRKPPRPPSKVDVKL